jgi:hypothetical protein
MLTKKRVNRINKKTKKMYGGKKDVLSEKIFDFLSSSDIISETNKLINKYSDSNELYKNLRKEIVETHKIDGNEYYRRIIKPERGFTKLLTQVLKHFKPNKSLRTSWWPAGDYDTYDDFSSYDNLKSYVYDLLITKKPPWTGKPIERYGDEIDYDFKKQFEYPFIIYVCFVIPFVMCKHSLKYNGSPPKGTFVFVYVAGGGGALVKNKSGKHKAYSCGHTFDFNHDGGIKKLNNRQFIIMLHDGTLAMLGNTQIKYDDSDENNPIDAGISEVLKPTLDSSYYSDIYEFTDEVTVRPQRSRRTRRSRENNSPKISINVDCYGSPSIITRNKNNTCKVDTLPDIREEFCWWDPLFFHKKNGNVIKLNQDTFDHSALVWQGMSGGPLINTSGEIVGLHHLADNDAVPVDQTYGIAMRADKMESLFE